MTQLILRRFLWMVLVLFVISVVTFLLMHSVPGGPFDREKPLPTETRKALEEKYNLNAPLVEQYVLYITDILVPRLDVGRKPPNAAKDYLVSIRLPDTADGEQQFIKWINFGPSFKQKSRSVNDVFRDNLPVSFQLGISALLISIVIGMPLGVISALNRNTYVDYMAMGVAILGVSVPSLVSATVLQYLFTVNLKWLPPTGWGTFGHMILPSLALGFISAALIARLTRASLLQVLNEDFIRTARAKGLSERRVISYHALRNSLIPVVTILGPLFANLVTGTFIVETIFGIPGMGQFFVNSIQSRDYTTIMGTTLMYAFILVVSNLAVDITYAWIDPRIRYN